MRDGCQNRTRQTAQLRLPPQRQQSALRRWFSLLVTPQSDTNLLTAAMGELGLEFKAFENAAGLSRGWTRRVPDLMIIDVAANGVDAIDTVFMLAERKYNGVIQFTAEAGTATVEGVMRAAERHGLRMLPPMTRPFDSEQIKTILQEQKTAALHVRTIKDQARRGVEA